MKVVFEEILDQSPERVWALVRDFTAVPWLAGPSNVSESEYEGRLARVLEFGEGSGIEPIVEYLLDVNPKRRTLQYGVVRNPFVPVDGYRAVIEVETAGDATLLRFTGSFEESGDPDQVRQLLLGAYQMMAQGIGAHLRA